MQTTPRNHVDEELDRIDATLRAAPDQHLDFLANRELIQEILQLREEKNALILGHNYMSPLVYQLSEAEHRGDSLGLSPRAAESHRPVRVCTRALFLAETAKILSPEKKVLIADTAAGCSLADGFTAADAEHYRQRFPGAPVVTYVNSYADVKAASDYCCTSANAPSVVKHAAEAFGSRTVIFLPDTLMGQNLEHELREEGHDLTLAYPGKDDHRFQRCEVHDKFTAEQIRMIRKQYNMPKGATDTAVLVHWECPPEVLEEADFYGSTSQMAKHIRSHPDLRRVYLGTECEMAANLASEFPSVEFVKACSVYCQHMARITLEKLRNSLADEVHEVHVDPDVARRARTAIDRMLEIPG